MEPKEKRMQVIGIYGVNASGKSTLSHMLARDFLEYDIETTDNLFAVKRRLNQNNPILQYSSYSQWERLGEPTACNVWKGFQDYRESMRDYLHWILERARDQRVGMIIEGVHIIPEHFLSFARDMDITLFLLHIDDLKKHKERMLDKCCYRPGLLTRFEKYFDNIRQLQRSLLIEAQDSPIKIIETGVSLESAITTMKSFLQ
ncbi:MAG: hypothetical protein Q8L34_03730 [Candidatus Woesearchaeota archaeon]|nr:hypothetical protein [Candidatus Woesearchaeota archaeon]